MFGVVLSMREALRSSFSKVLPSNSDELACLSNTDKVFTFCDRYYFCGLIVFRFKIVFYEHIRKHSGLNPGKMYAEGFVVTHVLPILILVYLRPASYLPRVITFSSETYFRTQSTVYETFLHYWKYFLQPLPHNCNSLVPIIRNYYE